MIFFIVFIPTQFPFSKYLSYRVYAAVAAKQSQPKVIHIGIKSRYFACLHKNIPTVTQKSFLIKLSLEKVSNIKTNHYFLVVAWELCIGIYCSFLEL